MVWYSYPSCVTLGRSLHFSEPWMRHPSDGGVETQAVEREAVERTKCEARAFYTA